MSSSVLMENAGRGTVDALCELGVSGPVVICCGKGNNAGDGFVIARHLDIRGVDVRILLFGDAAELHGDATENFKIVQKSGIPWRRIDMQREPERLDAEISGAAWLIDALLGTGTQGEPRPPFAQVIDAMNASDVPILAVDLPSGLDCDTGQPAVHTILAAHTCTFVAAKPGFSTPAAKPFVGTLHVLDIGAPRKLIDDIAAGR